MEDLHTNIPLICITNRYSFLTRDKIYITQHSRVRGCVIIIDNEGERLSLEWYSDIEGVFIPLYGGWL